MCGNKDKWDSEITFNKTNPSCVSIVDGIDQDVIDNWDKNNITMEQFYDKYVNHYGGTTHMTLIFDVFVVYTLFNQINCRMIDDSFNTFKRINKGFMFCIVTLCELIIQIVLSQFGRQVFHCVLNGLSFIQWMICLGFSISTMLFNFIIKLIPLENCLDKYAKPPETEQADAKYARTTAKEIINKNLTD